MKRELMWIPFLGMGLALFSPIFINRADRKNAMRLTVEIGKERLAQGFASWSIPKARASPSASAASTSSAAPTSGANRRARAAGRAQRRPVVARNSFLKRPGTVTVVIGEPIDSAGHTPEQLMRKVEDWIEAQVEILVRAERTHAA